MKRIAITSMICLLLSSVPAIAATSVDSIWSGSGSFSTTFTAGDDAHSALQIGAFSTSGEFHGIDYDNNPYGYGVDTVTTSMKASVSGGGFIELLNSRDDSQSSYGNAGQVSYSYVESSDMAELAWYSSTNYAEMGNCQYSKPTTSNGKNFEASGLYTVYHEVTDSDGDGSSILAVGDGSAKIKLQGEKSSGSSFNMGRLPICGDGCAWNGNYATLSGSGVGGVEINAWSDNGLSVGGSCPSCGLSIPGDGAENSATYNLYIGYAGDFEYQDFGVSGN